MLPKQTNSTDTGDGKALDGISEELASVAEASLAVIVRLVVLVVR